MDAESTQVSTQIILRLRDNGEERELRLPAHLGRPDPRKETRQITLRRAPVPDRELHDHIDPRRRGSRP